MNDAMNKNVTLEDLNNKLQNISEENQLVKAVFSAINPDNKEKKEGADQAGEAGANADTSASKTGENANTQKAADNGTNEGDSSTGQAEDQNETNAGTKIANTLLTDQTGANAQNTLTANGSGDSSDTALPGLLPPASKFRNISVAPASDGEADANQEGENSPNSGKSETNENQNPDTSDAKEDGGSTSFDENAAANAPEKVTKLVSSNLETYMKGIGTLPNSLLYGVDAVDEEFALPVSSGEITSDFGARIDPIDGTQTGFHGGLDIACEEKNASVHAALAGTVEDVGYEESYGNYVKIRHSDELETLYAHCESIQVKVGDTIEKDQVIARQGMSGRATWYHVHFEVRYNGERVNPIEYVPAYLSM